jgi:hypothetical protein
MDSKTKQSLNRAKRAAAIKAEILDREDDFLDIFDLERETGISLRQVAKEENYNSEYDVFTTLFDKIA